MQKENITEGRVYEVGYHVIPTDAAQIEKVVQGVRELITKAGGALIAEGAPQEMKLAYTMYVNNQGKNTAHDRVHFGWIKFEIDSALVKDIEAALAINREILRSIVFKTVREETRASVRAGMLREVKRGETLKAPVKHEEAAAPEVSEEKLEEALDDITGTV